MAPKNIMRIPLRIWFIAVLAELIVIRSLFLVTWWRVEMSRADYAALLALSCGETGGHNFVTTLTLARFLSVVVGPRFARLFRRARLLVKTKRGGQPAVIVPVCPGSWSLDRIFLADVDAQLASA